MTATDYNKPIIIFPLIGLILGLSLDGLVLSSNVYAFNYVLLSLFAFLYAITYDEKNCVRLVLSSFIIALYLSVPLISLKIHSIRDAFTNDATFPYGFLIFIYIGYAFHYAYHRDNSWRLSYKSLFAAVWNIIPQLLVAGLYTATAKLLIVLASYAFSAVGINYLGNLYFKNVHFRLITNTTLFFIGMGIVQENIKIIYNLRFLLLKMMYYLFSFLALITVLYFGLYICSLAGKQQVTNPLTLLIPLSSLGIIFFNAYFQDGYNELNTFYLIRIFLCIYRIILFFLVLMMVYKIFQTTKNIEANVIVYLITMVLYSLTYASTSFFSKIEQREWLQRGNIISALFFMITFFLINGLWAMIAFF